MDFVKTDCTDAWTHGRMDAQEQESCYVLRVLFFFSRSLFSRLEYPSLTKTPPTPTPVGLLNLLLCSQLTAC